MNRYFVPSPAFTTEGKNNASLRSPCVQHLPYALLFLHCSITIVRANEDATKKGAKGKGGRGREGGRGGSRTDTAVDEIRK